MKRLLAFLRRRKAQKQPLEPLGRYFAIGNDAFNSRKIYFN